MSKLYKQLVEVKLVNDLPAAFLWRGMWRFVISIKKVQVRRDRYDPFYCLDTYRVNDRSGGVFDLVKTEEGWVLERVWD